MRMQKIRKIGIWVLIYDFICVGVLGFSAYFGLSLGYGDSGVINTMSRFSNFLFHAFEVLVMLGFCLGFILLFIAAIGFMDIKDESFHYKKHGYA